MNKRLSFLPVLMGLAVVACSNSDTEDPGPPTDPPETPSVARSEVARDSAASIPATTLEAIVDADNAFAFDLYEKVRTDTASDNMILSPLSVSLAMSMTYAGAQNTTASEMAESLHFNDPSLDVHGGQNALSQALASRAADALAAAEINAQQAGSEAPSPDDFRLHIVNSVWGDGSYTWEQPFLDTLARSYGTGVYLADFIHQYDAERVRINTWVSEETHDKINDLLPDGSLNEMTRLVLVNAMHLKMPWEMPFSTEATAAGTFNKTDGTTVSADFMSQQDSFSYYEDDNMQLAALPLVGRQVSFVVALPKGTLDDLESSLASDTWKTAWDGRASQEVALKLPKFSFTSQSIKLRDTFKALGTVQAFDPDQADFYGMCNEPPNSERLFISEIIHKAMMAVDENGVEAAAATAVLMSGGTSVPPEPVAMVVDKPFVVAIVDEPTGALLFLGHITDPTAAGSE
jgi:serine protease inhibitor